MSDTINPEQFPEPLEKSAPENREAEFRAGQGTLLVRDDAARVDH